MDMYIATFIQLVVSAFVLIVISLLTDDIRLLFHASFFAILNFAIAGFLRFLVGWTFLWSGTGLILGGTLLLV